MSAAQTEQPIVAQETVVEVTETPVEETVTEVTETPVEETVTKVTETPVEEAVAESEAQVEEKEVVEEPVTVASLIELFPELDMPENAERTLLKAGELSRQARFKKVSRKVYLLNDFVLLVNIDKSNKTLKQVIDLSTATMVEKPKGKNTVGVKTPGRTFTFAASTFEEQAEWQTALAAAIKESTPVVEEVVVDEAVEEVVVEAEVVESVAAPVESEVVESEAAPVESEVVEKVAAVESEAAPVESEVVESVVAPVESEAAPVESEVVESEAAPVESDVVEKVAAVESEAAPVESEVVEKVAEASAQDIVMEHIAPVESEAAPVESEAAEEETVEEPAVELTEEQKAVAAVFAQIPALSLPENAERVLVKEGDLTRCTRFSTVPRKVYLFNDHAVLVKMTGKADKVKATLKQVIDLSTATVVDSKKKFVVCLKTPERQFVFKAADAEAQTEWIATLTTSTKDAAQKALVAKNGGGDVLYAAVIAGNIELVTELLEKSADATFVDEEGMTALHILAVQGNVEMIQLLASKGYSMDVVDKDGLSALQSCVTHGHRRVGSVCNALSAAGISTEQLLNIAVEAERIVSIDALIAAGADLESVTEEGKTALHSAVQAETPDIIKALINAGANPNARDNEQNTPLHFAMAADVAEMLVVAGGRVGIVNAEGVAAGSKFADLTDRKAGVTANDDVIAEKSAWVADSDSKCCIQCNASFGLFKRRHHCRRCGVLACFDCCSQKMTVEGSKQRACNGCFNVMASKVALAAKVEWECEEEIEAIAAVESAIESEAAESVVEEVPVVEEVAEVAVVEEVAVAAVEEVAVAAVEEPVVKVAAEAVVDKESEVEAIKESIQECESAVIVSERVSSASKIAA